MSVTTGNIEVAFDMDVDRVDRLTGRVAISIDGALPITVKQGETVRVTVQTEVRPFVQSATGQVTP